MKPLGFLERTPRFLGFGQIITASLCFGFLGVFGRMAIAQGLSVATLLTSRFSLAALAMGLYFVFFAPKALLIGWRQFLIASLQGLLGYAVFSTLYFKSLEGLPVALASILLFTYPLWLLFIHVLRGKSLSKTLWRTLALALLGLVLIFWGHIELKTMRSLLFGLASGLTFGIYVYVSTRIKNQVRPMASSFYIILGAALGLALFNHSPEASWKTIWLNLTPDQAWIIVGISVISTMIPLGLVLSSLHRLSSQKVALISLIEPITAALAGWFILSEQLPWLQILGGLFVLAAGAFQFSRTSREELHTPSQNTDFEYDTQD